MIFARKVRPEDKELIESWIERDEFHRGKYTFEDLIAPGSEAAILTTENGTPIQAIRFQKALRVAVQFNPDTPYSNAKAMKEEVISWWKELARKNGCTEIIVRPGGRSVKFAERLGFKDFIGKILGV